MITTLQSFLRELTFIQIPDIKRHAKGLLIALEKSNRKEFLEYEMIFNRDELLEKIGWKDSGKEIILPDNIDMGKI